MAELDIYDKLEISEGEVLDIHKDNVLLWEKSIEKTASGNGGVAFTGNRNRLVKSVVFKGKCEQDGTPSPDNPISIKSNNSKWQATGKNLLSCDSQTISIDDSYYSDLSFNNGKLNKVELIAGETYTISYTIYGAEEPFNSSVGCGNGIYTKDIATKSSNYNGRISITFTPTESDISGRRILAIRPVRYASKTTATYTISDIQLELGTTATSYEPYRNNGQIDLSAIILNGIGDVKDTYDSQTGLLTRKIGVVDLGDLSWIKSTTSTPHFWTRATGYGVKNNLLCTHYKTSFTGSWYNQDYLAYAGALHIAGNIIIVDHSRDNLSVDEFQAAMSGIIVYYELGTPTTEYISPQTITQIKGNDLLRQISGDIANTEAEITYYGRATL